MRGEGANLVVAEGMFVLIQATQIELEGTVVPVEDVLNLVVGEGALEGRDHDGEGEGEDDSAEHHHDRGHDLAGNGAGNNVSKTDGLDEEMSLVISW